MLDLSVAMFDFQRVPAPSHSPAISPPGVGFKECHGGRRHGRVCVRQKKQQQPTSVRITKAMQLVWVYNSVFIYVYQ